MVDWRVLVFDVAQKSNITNHTSQTINKPDIRLLIDDFWCLMWLKNQKPQTIHHNP